MVQAIPMVLAAGGKLIQGVAAMKAGKRNARAAYGQAIEEERAGAAQELRIRDAARAAMGEQVGAQFANGFQGGSGSALDALAESQINAAMDALTIRRETAAQARSLRAQGDNAKAEGKMALLGSIIDAGSTVGGFAADWASAKRGTTASRAPSPAPSATPSSTPARRRSVGPV